MPFVSFRFVCETETKPHKYAGELPWPPQHKQLGALSSAFWLDFHGGKPTAKRLPIPYNQGIRPPIWPPHLGPRPGLFSGLFSLVWFTKQLKQVCNQCANFLLANAPHTNRANGGRFAADKQAPRDTKTQQQIVRLSRMPNDREAGPMSRVLGPRARRLSVNKFGRAPKSMQQRN